MNQSQWDEKLKSFLKKTGEDVKRAGAEIKVEAEKLLKEVQDPDRQAKVRAGVKDFGGWARKTAEEMAELMETGVKKAEVALTKATDKVVDFASGQKSAAEDKRSVTPLDSPIAESGSDQEEVQAQAPSAPKKAKKSIGGSKKKSASPKKPAGKKSIGKAPKGGNNGAGS